MSKYHNDRTFASDPVSITLSIQKLRRLQPELFGRWGLFPVFHWGLQIMWPRAFREMLAEHLQSGDSRAAIVCGIQPELLVAAYTDEQDAVLVLRFPNYLVNEYNLQLSSRLLTVNTYGRGVRMVRDISPGQRSIGRYTNYYPIIAEFVSDDMDTIDMRKRGIREAEWKRCADFANAKLASPHHKPRDGRPLKSGNPA